MKKLALFCLIALAALGVSAQKTLVTAIQVKNQAGAPLTASLGTNGGLIVSDANGNQTKVTALAAFGSRVRKLNALNDTTLQVICDSATYTLLVRGGLTTSRQGWLDSARAGLEFDTTYIRNVGTGTPIAYSSAAKDTINFKSIKDSSVIARVGADSMLRFYLISTGVAPGLYGDASHIPVYRVRSDGRIDSASSVLISIPAAGLQKKTLNTVSGTAYTLAATDTISYIQTTNTSPVTISIPDDGTIAMSPPVNLELYQSGAGKVTIVPLNGSVTVSSPRGKFKTATQYSKIILNKISANFWILSGDLDTTTVPYLSGVPNSITNFTTTSGSASGPQTFQVYGGNLTTNVSVSAPTNFEISTDNTTYSPTLSLTPSSGAIAILVYARIKSTAPSGAVSGTVSLTSSPASATVFLTGTVNSQPAINTSGSLTAFSTSSGIASAAQSFTFTGAALTGNVTFTAGTGMEVSSNGTSYASTAVYTQSGGSASGTVFVRIAAATTSGSYSGNISGTTAGFTGTANVPFTATVSASNLTAKFNFSAGASAVSGWTNVSANPTTSYSVSDAGTGWVISSVGTGWANLSGFYGGIGNGATAGSTDGAFSQASINSNQYTYFTNFSSTGYNLVLSNLPAGTYSIEVLGSIPSATFNTNGPAAFHVKFGTGSDNIGTYTPNDNLTAVGPGTVGVQTGSFNGTITSGQTIQIAVCASLGSPSNGQLGLINGLIIIKTN